MALLDRILRAGEGKKVKALASLVPDINAFEPELKLLSDAALQGKTTEFRQRLERGDDLVAGQDHAIGEGAHLIESPGFFSATTRPLRRWGYCCCH